MTTTQPPLLETPPQPPVSPPPAPRNGFGITALIAGILGSILGLIPLFAPFALALGIVALVCGLVAVSRTRKGRATNGKTSWFGTALGTLAIILSIIGMVVVANAVSEVGDSLKGDTYKAADAKSGKQPKAENSPAKDVKMGTPVVNADEYDAHVPVTVTNHTDKTSDYSITVEWVDSEGNRISTGDAFVEGVKPGQTAKDKAVSLADSDDLGKLKSAEVKISKIDRHESL
jgi:hypothetical protein